MRYKTSLKLVILSLVFFIVVAPVLDSTLCDICKNHSPAQTKESFARPQLSAGEAIYSGNGSSEPENTGSESNQDLCSLCANSALTVAGLEFPAPVPIVQWHGTFISSPLSTINLFIFKPPQNSLA